MSNLSAISQAIHLRTHDPQKEILDRQRKEYKEQLHEMVNFFTKAEVRGWLDDTVEYGHE